MGGGGKEIIRGQKESVGKWEKVKKKREEWLMCYRHPPLAIERDELARRIRLVGASVSCEIDDMQGFGGSSLIGSEEHSCSRPTRY